MSGEDDNRLDDEIETRFIGGIEENDVISEEIAEVIKSSTDETDLGGREFLVERVKEVKGIDED